MATESLRTPSPNAARHDSFTLTRHLDAAPAAVFAAFADTRLWRKWFRMPGSAAEYEHDFRDGGRDLARSAFTHPDGRIERLQNRAVYLHIEPYRGIIFAYDTSVDDRPRWASHHWSRSRSNPTRTERNWPGRNRLPSSPRPVTAATTCRTCAVVSNCGSTPSPPRSAGSIASRGFGGQPVRRPPLATISTRMPPA